MNIEIQLPVAELKQALPGFTKIINKSSTLATLLHLRIQRSKEGMVSLQATNLDDFASVQLAEPQPGTPVDLLVPFETLAKFTKAASIKDSLRLKPGDGEAVLVYPLGNTYAEQKIQTMAAKEWPAIPTVHQAAIDLDDHFKAAFHTALDCASADETRRVLNGACLDVTDNKAHYVVGTDGRHLFSANSFAFDLEESLIIPSRKFLGWSGFVQDGPWKLAVKAPEKEDQPGWIQIESDRWTFITRQIEGKYPNWRMPFPDPSSDKTTVHLDDSAVEFLLSVIAKLPGSEKNQGVGLVVERDGLFLIKARAQENDDWTAIPVQGVEITGDPTTVHINRGYLAKALKLGMVNLELRSPDCPVILYSARQKLLIAPLRLEGPAPEPTAPQQPAPETPDAETPPVTPQPTTPAAAPLTPVTEEPMKTLNRNEPIQQNGQSNHESIETKVSALIQAAQQIDRIKDTLKGVVSDLNDALKVITQAQKEKRATEKEIESFRESLRALQRVRI